MKKVFTAAALLLSFWLAAQPTVTEEFQKINTVPEANAWMTAHASLKPTLLHLSTGKDSSLIEKRLLRQKKGDVFSVGFVTYKVIEFSEDIAYRANYIFLDGSSLAPAEVDSLKKLILQKYSAGTAFEKLSDQYTMDGNQTHGDTGWFLGEEQMPKEFQEAVKNHKTGELFFVDVSEKQWHYIVKKTYDDRDNKTMTVLRANGR